ncbi:hypothetical protein [Robertmurraya massiliosenegalensis]|uniref:hypothetical protein n=1 Tax=Robertmurraya massiliosenegalensis TaxID=1287657 RepID=UPI00037B6CF0|nr:hypothetical protein [Robertmurraya massiliosenegalensis]
MLIGAYLLGKYLHGNKGIIGIALITNAVFIGLGQYLEFYISLISFVTNIMGVILSFIVMVIFYYWKEGQKHYEVRIKNEKVEEELPKVSIEEKIKLLITLLKKARKYHKEKGYSKKLAFQFAFVEIQEEKSKVEEKNALDFVLGKEVILQRNEYDQNPQK